MRLVIIDDDPMVRESLRTILEAQDIEVVAMGSDGAEASGLYQRHRPDILLMDIRMGDMNGIDAARLVMKAYPDAKILFLTTFSDDDYIAGVLRIGGKGYILKQDFENIVPALHAVYKGQSVFGSEIINKLPTMLQKSSSFDYTARGISQKEKNIIQLVAEGLNNKEIADMLYLSEGTVRNYLSQVLDKLDLRDRTQLAIFYYQHK